VETEAPAFFFELLGESGSLPLAEAAGCVAAEAGGRGISSSGPGYAIARFPPEALGGIASRIGLTHAIGRLIGSYGPGEEPRIDASAVSGCTFAIRAKRFGGMMKDVDSQKLIRDAGAILSKGGDVDLRDPEATVRMLMSDRVYLYLEERAVEKNLLEKRKVGERPFFSPISLHPKYARALINLTGVRRGGTVLDPFCGTGGVAIEAAEMGMRAIASDFDEEMVIGCRENMDFYGLRLADFDAVDIGDIPERFGPVDAVATDPPYGRSTKTGGEDVSSIYLRAMRAISDALAPGGRAGIIFPRAMDPGPMRLDSVHEQRVHGSLSRHYHAFSKI
jgi:tRNA (guanine10-N2)-dimethyltransferase